MSTPAFMFLAVVALSVRLDAQQPPAPCLTSANARHFDFWIGEWNVSPANATVIVGRSVVQKVSGGCALLENWTATNGTEGKSLNTYNATVGQWQQFWVGQGGAVTEYRESRWRGDTLVFLAHGTTPQGAANLQRLSFFPVDANTVRQLGESSADDGKTWTAQYDLYYHRSN